MTQTAKTKAQISTDQSQLFLDLLQQLERVDPEFPLHYSICLTYIAMNEGISLTQLAEKTGLALSTVSRIVGALSDYRQNGQAYGLIEVLVAPTERRRKEMYLTTKGWAVMRGVAGVLENYHPDPAPKTAKQK